MPSFAPPRTALAFAALTTSAVVLTVLPGPARSATPAAADAASRIVTAWARLPRDTTGNPIDPVSGIGSLRYSQATLADAALSLPSPTAEQRAFAEHLLLWLATAGPQQPASVFEIAAAADAYMRLPVASPARAPLLGWLKSAPTRVWIEDHASTTFNKWMVEAEGDLARCRIPDLPARSVLCGRGRHFVERTFPAAMRRWTSGGARGRVTVMSDPPENPIAYHHLKFGYFAHVLSRLPRIARATRRALVQMARGTLAITAPDGEAAYWGRSQGQSWTLVFGAYGLRRAERYTTRAEAARFEHGARVMMARFRDLHEGGPLGVAIVPGYKRDPLTPYRGMDPYANVATYAGLTAMALTWLARTSPIARANAAPEVPPNGGYAHELGNGAFATATADGTWIAVRAHGNRSRDPRYDFGLVAAKRHTGTGWLDLVANRPLPGSHAASAGPLLTIGGVIAYPDGKRVKVSGNGTVTVDGGWRAPNEAWLRRATFVFRPTATGVVITVPVRTGDQISYDVFARNPQISGATVLDGGVRTALSLPGTGSEDPELHASASDRKLTRVTLTGIAGATRTAEITITG